MSSCPLARDQAVAAVAALLGAQDAAGFGPRGDCVELAGRVRGLRADRAPEEARN